MLGRHCCPTHMAQHTRPKQVAQDVISVESIIVHIHQIFEHHNRTHPQNSTWLLTLTKCMCKQWILVPRLSIPSTSLGTRLVFECSCVKFSTTNPHILVTNWSTHQGYQRQSSWRLFPLRHQQTTCGGPFVYVCVCVCVCVCVRERERERERGYHQHEEEVWHKSFVHALSNEHSKAWNMGDQVFHRRDCHRFREWKWYSTTVNLSIEG